MVITTTDIQLFQILKQKLGDKEAEALVSFVDAKIKESNEQSLKIGATKEDIANLSAELKSDIANLKTDTIKWFVALFITLALMIIGLYFKK